MDLPSDDLVIPDRCVLKFDPDYLARFKGRDDTDTIDGMLVSDHKKMQRWITRYTYEQYLAILK